jgi:hypothetical protein
LEGDAVAGIQAVWAKLNANERIVGYGAIIVLIGWLVSLVTAYGFGSFGFLPAIVILVIYWLKYGSATPINWPAPVSTIVLIIAAVAAIFMLPAIGYLGVIFSLFGLSFLLSVIGVLVMLYGAWMDYQAASKPAA